jgi:hypothetical protein
MSLDFRKEHTMKGDFSRFTFDAAKQYTRVLMQQGRALLDADWNEMSEIQYHGLRSAMRDLIGPYGGPTDNCGFRIAGNRARTGGSGRARRGRAYLRRGDFRIGEGRYYVDGIACENGSATTYLRQPDLVTEPLKKGVYLVYLDLWERHITYLEDPDIREVAIGGPDTTTRTKVVWQVKTHMLPRGMTCDAIKRSWEDLCCKWQPRNRGMLSATTAPGSGSAIDRGGYIGSENSLYRVEIHKGGRIVEKPSFKWSRENGSVAFKVLDVALSASNSTTTLTLDTALRSDASSLELEDWVEVLDDRCVLEARPGSLLQVKGIASGGSEVTLQGLCSESIGEDPSRLCVLRRWDQREGDGLQFQGGAVAIREGVDEGIWLDLEAGIRIRFAPGGVYRTGDYWLIPARPADNGVIWPWSNGVPVARPPLGVSHHYAPLAILNVTALGSISARDCRLAFRVKSQRPRIARRKP